MAITWRNVQGNRGFTDAGLLMRSANQSFQGASKTLNGILDRNTAIDDHNYETIKENNTDEYLNVLQSYATPEALQAAKDSGELEAKLKSLGPQIDQKQVRGADTARLTALRQEDNATTAFEKNKLMEEASPIMEKIKQLEIQGTPEARAEAQRLMQDNETLLSGVGELANLSAFGQTQKDSAQARQDAATARYRSQYNFDKGVKEDQLTEEQRQEQLAVYTTINEAAGSFRKEEANRELDLRNLADDYKIPLDEKNQPIWTEATDEALAGYAEAVRKQGLAENQSYTQRLTSIADKIRADNPDIDPALLESAISAAEQDQLRRSTISGADQLEKQNLVSQALSTTGASSTAFYQERDFQRAEVSTMIQDWAETVGDGDLVDQMVPLINEWVDAGVDIGNGEKVKLVPSQVRDIMTLVQDRWDEIDNNPAEAKELVINQPGFKAAARNWLNYQAEEQSIATSFDKAATASTADRQLNGLYGVLDKRMADSAAEEARLRREAEDRANAATSPRKSDEYLMDLKAQADAQGRPLTGGMLSQYRALQRRNN